MNRRFWQLVGVLDRKWQALVAMRRVLAVNVPRDTPTGGVYLFSEGSTSLYTGRTKRMIGARIRDHFSTALDCPLAWLLAREATGRKATYRREGSRTALLADPS